MLGEPKRHPTTTGVNLKPMPFDVVPSMGPIVSDMNLHDRQNLL